MSLNIQGCLANMRNALGGTDISPELDGIAIINRAGEHLVSMHDWNWLRTNATLSLTNAQSYVDLPTRFKSLLAVVSPLATNLAGAASGVQMTSFQALLDRRNDGSSVPPLSQYIAAITSYNPPSGTDGRVFWRLELWPTPTVPSGGETLDIFYKQSWKVVDNSTETVLEMPEWLEETYLQTLRAFAKGVEAEEVATLDQRLSVIAQGPLFRAAVSRDSIVNHTLGVIENAAVATTLTPDFRSGTVNAPT